MSMALDFRDQIATALADAVGLAGKSIVVRSATLLVLELEDEAGTLLEITPLATTRTRDYRVGWTRIYTIRTVLRRMSTGRNPSQIAAIEEAFLEEADWVAEQIEKIQLTGPYGIQEIADADIALREPYLESGQLVMILDVNVLAVADG